MGVVFARPDEGDRILAIARNVERNLDSVAEIDSTESDESDMTETEDTTHE
jgi:DNA gyrase subunit A